MSEPYQGGDLSSCVEKAQEAGVRITKGWLAGLLKQACEGIAYLHSQKSIHCDIKEANIMITGKDDWAAPNVIVIDFGLAQSFGSSTGPARTCGTPGYMPPEVWARGLWTPKGDVFSLGVLFYHIVCQRFPFDGNTMEQIEAATKKCTPDMSLLSGNEEYQSLVEAMLTRDLRKRPGILQVLAMPFWASAGATDAELPAEALEQLSKLQRRSKLAEAVLAEISATENLGNVKEINNLFVALDKDHSGKVTAEEVRAALGSKLPEAQLEQMIAAMMDDDGAVVYSMFMANMLAAKQAETGEVFWHLFNRTDSDHSGKLSKEEVEALLAEPAVAQALGKEFDIAHVMQKMDPEGTGVVDFFHFKQALEVEAGGATSTYAQGQSVQYLATAEGEWTDTVVTAVDRNGAVQVEARPGFWFRGPGEQAAHLRLPPL